ncbi:MAG: hypothetical protein IT434_12590 [Phycisphaerales bacterium]|jgi:hypothetical protein|nr:hypothetical protein [Phycisphaerales bacterium]
MLAGLPGAESGMEISGPPGLRIDPTAVAGKLRQTEEDGRVTLRARAPRHLMKHVYDTIFNDEPRLFVDQVLCDLTKEEYGQRGLDPSGAFDILRQHREDIHKLFNAMPQGELTPGLFLEPVGGNVKRLCVYGPMARDLRWNGFDMVMEHGMWKLRWFVNNQR